MSDKIELINYYSNLCSVLNENGFRIHYKMDGEVYDDEFETNTETPRLTAMDITENLDAFIFLNNKGFIRSNLCHFCGESPIDGRYNFTEPINHIRINICKSCHSGGKREQVNFKNAIKPNSGCLLSLAILVSMFIMLIPIPFFFY